MNEELAALQGVVTALNAVGVPYLVGGSFASSAWGKARFTNDFDLAVLMLQEHVDPFIDALGSSYVCSRVDLMRAIESQDQYPNAQLIHFESLHRFDLFVVRDNDYTRSSFERALNLSTGEGQVKVASPETIVIEKLRWYESGNRVSDRQWNDIVQVIESQGDRLDLSYLTFWTDQFDVRDLLRDALSQARPLG